MQHSTAFYFACQWKNNKIQVRYGVYVLNFFVILIIELRERRRKKRGEERRGDERRQEKREGERRKNSCFHHKHGPWVTKLGEQCLVVPTRCWPSGYANPPGIPVPYFTNSSQWLYCQQAWPSQGFLHTPSVLSPPSLPWMSFLLLSVPCSENRSKPAFLCGHFPDLSDGQPHLHPPPSSLLSLLWKLPYLTLPHESSLHGKCHPCCQELPEAQPHFGHKYWPLRSPVDNLLLNSERARQPACVVPSPSPKLGEGSGASACVFFIVSAATAVRMLGTGLQPQTLLTSLWKSSHAADRGTNGFPKSIKNKLELFVILGQNSSHQVL